MATYYNEIDPQAAPVLPILRRVERHLQGEAQVRSVPAAHLDNRRIFRTLAEAVQWIETSLATSFTLVRVQGAWHVTRK